MAKLALNSALLAQGVANSSMVGTVFDGISRHTREGYAFQLRSATASPHSSACLPLRQSPVNSSRLAR
ncbi:hypothetical protein CJ469_06454 [Nocardia farcinica]|nr:hypothetical protein CJ469_06454 [Nocardia farcinica]